MEHVLERIRDREPEPAKPSMEAMALKAEILGLTLLGIVAALSPDQQFSAMGGALVGSAVGGFAGVYFIPAKTFRAKASRWSVNFVCGIPVALWFTAKYYQHYEYLPISWLSGIAGFFAGPLMVLAIPIMIPFLRDVIRAYAAYRRDQLKPPSDPPPTSGI